MGNAVGGEKDNLQRILRLRTASLVAALFAPVAILGVRVLFTRSADSDQFSTDLFMTVFLMAGFTAIVWFGFKSFMKREAQVAETRSRLESSKSRYTRALNSAGIGVWELNIQTNELFWSEEIAPLFGYGPGELATTNENFLSAVHSEDRHRVVTAVDACINESAEYDIEHRVVWPDGTVRWMHERGYVERSDNGDPYRMFGIVEDVTDKRLAQLNLAESEDRYESIVSNVPGVVFRIDVVGDSAVYKYISSSCKELFGIDAQEALDDIQSIYDTVHPEDRGSLVDAVVSEDRVGSVSWDFRIVVDGKVKWIESRATHKRQPDGSIRIDGVVFDVSKEVESERKLSASEARFERMVENAPGMVYQMVHTPEDVVSFTYVSPEIEEIFGLTQQELIESPMLLNSCLHEDDHDDHQKLIHEALAKLEDFNWVGRIRRTDGEVRFVQLSCKPSKLEDGTVIWDAMVIDVTAEKRSAEELRVTRDRLADLLGSSPAVIYACEVESPYALNYISENVSEHLGYSRDECLQNETFLADRTHPEDKEATLALLESINQTGHSSIEYRLKKSSGEYRWIRDEMRFVARPDKHEIVGTLIDITKRKLAEEALRLSDERFRAMSGASPLGIFMADKCGGIVYVNSKMAEVLLIQQENLYGDVWQSFVHEADLDRMTSILSSSISSETPFALECRLTKSNHSVIWCSINAAPMFDHGALVGFVGTVEDITDRRDLEIVSEQARIEAERASQAKSEFLSRMSHELRTPLNAILGYAQLLEMESSFVDGEPLSQILKSGRHLLSLINEVLDIAKIESGDLGIELEPIKIKTIVDEVAQLLQPIAHEKAVALDIKIDQYEMTYVFADHHRLKQVILNVVSNAIKYNKPEGIVTVMIERGSGNTVELIVRDTGKGIPPDKLHRLFTPFDRLGAEASKVEGTGLGLALTHRLLSALGGEIEIESEEGVGTIAKIKLRLSENPELSLAPLRDLGITSSEQVYKSARILLIEDNEANIKLMETILSRRPNHILDVAMTGSLGIDLAKRYRPDLILLDINLPDSIGTNVIDRIKSDPILEDTDVIVISADANKKQLERFQNAGAVAYLTKPVNVRELLRLIDGVLDHVKNL